MSPKFDHYLHIRGAREHNLKNISIDIPRDSLVVITGLSGSGKSSLAFDTIYAEGQRRYVESLSAYARQFLGIMEKPDVDFIDGLSPAISIEQKSTHRNPRSTVGTVTEIYDYLRLLFARIGVPYCPNCDIEITSRSVDQIVDQILSYPEKTKIQILSPIVQGKKGTHEDTFDSLRKKGFVRVRVDGELRTLDEEFSLVKNRKHSIDVIIDRIVLKEGIRSRLADSVETALDISDGLLLADIDGVETVFSSKHSCPSCGYSIPEISPRMFSFNNPYGACEMCSGLGFLMRFNDGLIVPDDSLAIEEGAVRAWGKQWTSEQVKFLNRNFKVDTKKAWKKLPQKDTELILYSTGDRESRKYPYSRHFEGVIPNLERRYRETASDDMRKWMEGFMLNQTCPECNGRRLRQASLHVRVSGTHIYEVTEKSIRDAHTFFQEISLTETERKIASQVLAEIRNRLSFLTDVGLDYLTLNRAAGTLSGGEAQRIRLATQIGSSLTGVLYVLDEPSIGLHQRDNQKLLGTLKQLRDLGNTVIVVEHDEETMMEADFIVDLGPEAGLNGGYVVCSGTPKEVMKCPDSLTGLYLSGKRSIPVPKKRLQPKEMLTLRGARENNLKAVDVDFPLGVFCCVTGVSGSGKSTLIMQTLYKVLSNLIMRSKLYPGAFDSIEGVEKIDKVIHIDQSPIGRTPRSNPATYTGIFTPVRDLFSQTAESRMRGYKPGRFSFNVSGGRCEACEGDGIKKIEMHFLSDAYITCEVCKGKRYNHETLEVRYKGKNIFEILEMSVNEAMEFFENVPAIHRRLQTLQEVGLGYIKLGQSATTLSGGEAQRIKLSSELSKRATGKTMYILDEPTTGLHFADIEKLLKVLRTLVEKGNTVLVIEHNLDVVKTADYVIDMGPDGGDNGGRVIATGTPEAVAQVSQSYTGAFLKKIL
ncbi:MAG: excinuclease ABC subunit UvrA [Spirochaetota bacterium]